MQHSILFRQAVAQDVVACWQIVDEARNNMMAEGKQQWDIVDPGFKLCAPVQKQAPVRPRK